ncbi:hypothetical protein ABIA39_004470 [Nocardia sp. GAS34]|uniref:hypothetical protein n=1 Tax=unclassified Nocardia TaxID=2637762 RepID=UPI003D1C03AD
MTSIGRLLTEERGRLTVRRVLTVDGGSAKVETTFETEGELHQFLGSGYNAGGMTARSLGVAEGHDQFQPSEVEHGQSSVNVYQTANQILCGSGAYR